MNEYLYTWSFLNKLKTNYSPTSFSTALINYTDICQEIFFTNNFPCYFPPYFLILIRFFTFFLIFLFPNSTFPWTITQFPFTLVAGVSWSDFIIIFLSAENRAVLSMCIVGTMPLASLNLKMAHCMKAKNIPGTNSVYPICKVSFTKICFSGLENPWAFSMDQILNLNHYQIPLNIHKK